jgi:hypothetical protein
MTAVRVPETSGVVAVVRTGLLGAVARAAADPSGDALTPVERTGCIATPVPVVRALVEAAGGAGRAAVTFDPVARALGAGGAAGLAGVAAGVCPIARGGGAARCGGTARIPVGSSGALSRVTSLETVTRIGFLQFRQGTLPPRLASARATSSPRVTIVEQTLHRICIALRGPLSPQYRRLPLTLSAHRSPRYIGRAETPARLYFDCTLVSWNCNGIDEIGDSDNAPTLFEILAVEGFSVHHTRPYSRRAGAPLERKGSRVLTREPGQSFLCPRN